MMYELGFKQRFFTAVVLTAAVPAVGALLTLPFWGRVLDRRHPGRVVAFCYAFWAFIPVFYHRATPANALWMVGIAWAIAGVFPTGFLVARPVMTARLSGEDKTMPAALIWVKHSVGLMLGSAVGTLIVRAHGTQAVFMVSFAGRAVAAFLAFLLLVYYPWVIGRRDGGGKACSPGSGGRAAT